MIRQGIKQTLHTCNTKCCETTREKSVDDLTWRMLKCECIAFESPDNRWERRTYTNCLFSYKVQLLLYFRSHSFNNTQTNRAETVCLRSLLWKSFPASLAFVLHVSMIYSSFFFFSSAPPPISVDRMCEVFGYFLCVQAISNVMKRWFSHQWNTRRITCKHGNSSLQQHSKVTMKYYGKRRNTKNCFAINTGLCGFTRSFALLIFPN